MSMRLTLGFRKCTEVHFPSLVGTFDTLKATEALPDGQARDGPYYSFFFFFE
jgi:hypothetical protein